MKMLQKWSECTSFYWQRWNGKGPQQQQDLAKPTDSHATDTCRLCGWDFTLPILNNSASQNHALALLPEGNL